MLNKDLKQWSLSIVVFHSLLIFSVIVLFISGDEEDYLLIHENFGYFVALLIIYRFYFSFKTNASHEKMSSWIHSKKELIYFFKNFFNHKESKYHNPASSLIMIILILLLIANIITGSLGLAGSEGDGYLSYFLEINSKIGDIFLDLHNVFGSLLFIFISFHVLGSIIGSIIIKHNLIKYIFKFKK